MSLSVPFGVVLITCGIMFLASLAQLSTNWWRSSVNVPLRGRLVAGAWSWSWLCPFSSLTGLVVPTSYIQYSPIRRTWAFWKKENIISTKMLSHTLHMNIWAWYGFRSWSLRSGRLIDWILTTLYSLLVPWTKPNNSLSHLFTRPEQDVTVGYKPLSSDTLKGTSATTTSWPIPLALSGSPPSWRNGHGGRDHHRGRRFA